MPNPTTKPTTPKPARKDLPLGATAPGKLVVLRGGDLPIKSDESGEGKVLPERIRFLKWGVNNTSKGQVILNETSAAVVPHNQRITGHDHVALDFQHNSAKAGPKDEPIKIAGNGNLEIVPGDGIYITSLEYTPEGEKVLPGGHYKDVSGAVRLNEKGEVIWVHSVGAVRNGAAEDMVLFEAGEKAREAIALLQSDGKLSLIDDDAGDINWREMTLRMLASLGVEIDPDQASDAEAAGAVMTWLEGKQAPDNSQTKDNEEEESESSPTTTMSTEKTTDQNEQFSGFDERLKLLEANSLISRRDSIVERASREGKVIPLSSEQIEGLKTEGDIKLLESMVANLPAGEVPVSGLEHAGQRGGENPGAGLTKADLEVCELLGVDPEDMKKHNGIKTEATAA